MSRLDVEKRIKVRYSKFFEDMRIDENTGIIKNNPKYKFSSYPFIGSEYSENDNLEKILYIGLTTGADFNEVGLAKGGIQSIDERRYVIEGIPIAHKDHNEHIAATYTGTLYRLRKNNNWEKNWNLIKNYETSKRAVSDESLLPKKNLLSFVSLTNIHKFVEAGNPYYSGSGRYIDKEKEENLVCGEIFDFEPDIVIFQSETFISEKKELITRIIRELELNEKIYIGPHPTYHRALKEDGSYQYRGIKVPDFYVKQIKKVLLDPFRLNGNL